MGEEGESGEGSVGVGLNREAAEERGEFGWDSGC